jgi:hypothetical protein
MLLDSDQSLLPMISIEESNLLIAGTGRNVAATIENEVYQLRNACKNFKSIKFLIVESDSTDTTVSKLTQLESMIDGFKFIALGTLEKAMPRRVDRIAYCRNKIVEAVRSESKFTDINFVIMADLDGLNDLLSAEKIKNCWATEQKWDVVTANQLDFYYDIYALRHKYWSPVNCQVQQEHLEPLFGHEQSVNLAVWAKQVQLKSGNHLIEVDSAFGGFAIYKKEAFVVGNYAGNENGVEICEHVPFHQAIREAGFKIYISCALINCKRPAEPPNSKSNNNFSNYFINIVRILGIKFFGKKRFKKYLNNLLDTDSLA